MNNNSRRDSRSDGPPSTDVRGSIHNLQLDIMDDIVQARKARMKLWNTSSEKVCEVQTVNETGSNSPMRYSNRRFSDFVGNTCSGLPTIASFRRASENPSSLKSPMKKPTIKTSLFPSTNLLSSLASSAIEINKCEEPPPKEKTNNHDPSCLDAPDGAVKSKRSNSFDVSFLYNVKKTTSTEENNILTGWFTKRHQPISKKNTSRSHSTAVFTRDVLDRFKESGESRDSKKHTTNKDGHGPIRKLIRDGKNAIVDSQVLGSTIGGFFRDNTSSSSSGSQNKGAIPKDSTSNKKKATSTFKAATGNWFGKGNDDDSNDRCDSSLCSTLKDLFVK